MPMTRIPSALLVALALAAPASAQPADDPRAVAHQVYDELVRVMGLARPPVLTLVQRDQPQACYDARRGRIELDLSLTDAVADLGDAAPAALALVLGHELGHAMRQHTPSSCEPEHVDAASAMVEQQADELGLFYGYMAGYRTLDVAAPFLDRWTADQGHPVNAGARAPTGTLTAAAARLRPVVDLFDAAVQLLVIGEYEAAGDAFSYLARRFPTPEMLNNAGVALVLGAVDDQHTVYPLELDPTTRLRAQGERRGFGFAGAAQQRRSYEAALRRFGEAHGRYPDYRPAALNLASTHALLADLSDLDEAREHRRRAEFHAETARLLAEREGNAPAVARATIVQGLLRDLAGDGAAAERALRAALADEPALAAANLHALNLGPAPAPSASVTHFGEAEVGGHRPGELSTAVAWGIPQPIAPGFRMKIESEDGWQARRIEIGDPGRGFTIVHTATTTDAYRGEVLDIRVGTALDELEQRLGTADRAIPAPRGSYQVFDAFGVAFRVEDGRVTGWMIYDVE